MTNFEQIQALEKLGYDAVESAFLAVAALHSGYFLRRQFLEFGRGTRGSKDIHLLTKLKEKGHGRATAYRHGRLVYHLASKPLYDTLGEPDSRNRREHQPSTIKSKIMILDFVLERPGCRFLTTEREKLSYFQGTRSVPTTDLPIRRYASPSGHESAKHFGDGFPIYFGQKDLDIPHFCYVDEGLQTTDRFATYLGQYQSLFKALGNFRVVYAAETPRLFASAHRVFEKLMNSLRRPFAGGSREYERLLDHFQRRLAYENRDFSGFDTASLIHFREERRRFEGQTYEDLYEDWKAGNAAKTERPEMFSTLILDHDYDLFGTLTSPNAKRRKTEIATEVS